MKVLIVGGDYSWSIERFYAKHLNNIEELEADLFPAQNILYSYLEKGTFYKVKHRLGLTSIYNKINLSFKDKVEDFKPDFVWVFKGMEIFPESLTWAKSRGVKLINYNPDNPFIFTGRGSGNKNVKDSIDLFDLHYTYNLEILEQLQISGKFISKLLPFAYELPESLGNFDLQNVEEIVKVCFIGNPDLTRADFLNKLLSNNVLVDLYGNNWNKYIKHENASIKLPVYGDELWLTLKKYRVQLNMLRVHNLNSHNMRTFEIPGVGGIQLAPFTREHDYFFENKKEIFMYKNVSEATRNTRELLQMNSGEAEQIRNNALSKCETNGYTYKARAKEVYDMFTQL